MDALLAAAKSCVPIDREAPPFVSSAAFDLEFRRWTPLFVKSLLRRRQSWEPSFVGEKASRSVHSGHGYR